jgi:template-activating factor I
VLKKEYKFEPSNAAADEKPDVDGITSSMLEFSWERDVSAQVCLCGLFGAISYA